MFTTSRTLWFVGLFLLTAPLLVAFYGNGRDLSAEVWFASLGTAVLISGGFSMILGRKPGDRRRT